MANQITDDDYWLANLVDHKQRLSTDAAATLLNDKNSDHCLKILHINMRSLVNKMANLELFLSQLNIDFSCIVISETWFSHNEYFPKYFLDCYHLSCSSRPDGGGGGVCVYVSEKLEASVTDIPLTGAEAMMVRISCSGRLASTVLAVYRTPSVGPSAFLDDLGALLPTLPPNSAVVGDLNFDLNPENDLDSCSFDYLRMMSSNGFYNIINSPTRPGNTKFSLLDHIFINNNEGQNISSCTISTVSALSISPFYMSLRKAKQSRSQNLTRACYGEKSMTRKIGANFTNMITLMTHSYVLKTQCMTS